MTGGCLNNSAESFLHNLCAMPFVDLRGQLEENLGLRHRFRYGSSELERRIEKDHSLRIGSRVASVTNTSTSAGASPRARV